MISSGRPIFGDDIEKGFFARLGEFAPGLVVDAGAGWGFYTEQVLRYASGSRVLCFEPFPGNWPFIEKAIAGHDARLIKSALGAFEGEADFYVSGTANAVGTWKDFEGYSSSGMIVPAGSRAGSFKVPLTTVDANVDERLLLLKIDVQGGEIDVLRGASKTFERGIDFLYVEFTGEAEILTFLLDRGYRLYDRRYTLFPRVKAPDLSGWDIVNKSIISTGGRTLKGWPKATPSDPEAYCEMFRDQAKRIGFIVTDLVAVAPQLAIANGR
jgi:FkbM family methyltransferase